MAEIIRHPNDTGLYSNISLGPTWFPARNKNELQQGWEVQYKSLLKTFFKNDNSPYVIFMHVGSITYLENSKTIIPKKSKALVDKKGLRIYLSDALSTYFIDDKTNSMYVDYEKEQEHLIRCKELDSISLYVKRNKLKNVSVFVPNYGAEHIFGKVYDNFQIMCSPVGWIYPATIEIEAEVEHYTDKIKKHFWNGNWRYTSHRHILASYLAGKHLDTTNLSWLYESSDVDLIKHTWFQIDNLAEYKDIVLKGANTLSELSPISMGIDVKNKLRIKEIPPFIHINTNPKEHYQDSFCAIVSETRFADSTCLLTEKIMNAILNYRPFIMVGPPGNLKYMKRWGFETYNEFWDESYDDETCHYKRMCKIFKLIDDIASMSVKEIKQLHTEMYNTLSYNYFHILNLQEDLLETPIAKNKTFKKIRYAH